jgi:hypothetical protein
MVDAVVGLPALLGLGFAGAALPAIYSRMKRGGSRPRLADGPDADEKAGRRLPSSASSRRWLLAGSLIALPGRNWRGPGARVVGLRRVEARTGGPVTIRSALIRFAVTTAWSELIGQLNRPAGQRLRERGQAIHSEMHDLLDEHAGDPKAQQQAISDRYKAGDLSRSMRVRGRFSALSGCSSRHSSRRCTKPFLIASPASSSSPTDHAWAQSS